MARLDHRRGRQSATRRRPMEQRAESEWRLSAKENNDKVEMAHNECETRPVSVGSPVGCLANPFGPRAAAAPARVKPLLACDDERSFQMNARQRLLAAMVRVLAGVCALIRGLCVLAELLCRLFK